MNICVENSFVCKKILTELNKLISQYKKLQRLKRF